MIVASNNSPIINLACIGSLDILRKLYKKIFIPQAVFFEISNYNQPGCEEIKNYDWFVKKTITNQSLALLLAQDLDKGESEAITLALECKAALLLIDEKLGKAKALTLGLKCTGIIGVLLQAKSSNIISAIKPYLNDLIYKAGFYISKDVYEMALKLAQEN